MNFETSSAEIFVNLEELVYMPGLIDHFLTNDTEKQSTAKKSDETTVHSRSVDEDDCLKKGQPSLIQLFPSIVNVASEFIKQHSF